MIEKMLEVINDLDENNLKLYFVTRALKDETVSKRTKVIDKYIFNLYSVMIDDDIRTHLKDLTIEQFEFIQKKNYELQEYEVISDDTAKIFTYSMKNNGVSFKDIVENQINKGVDIPPVISIEKITQNEELWAYCIEIKKDDSRILTFRKILKSKVAIDESDVKEGIIKKVTKSLRTIFDVNTQKLELLEGETINLDKQIDCIYFNSTFYIIHKYYFEQIVGLEQEYKQQSINFVTELEELKSIEGIELLKNEVSSNPSIYRKLIKIIKLGEYKNLDDERVERMKTYSDSNNLGLKTINGKLKIEDKKDLEVLIKFLADYYKDSQITGIKYGTFSGTKLGTEQN